MNILVIYCTSEEKEIADKICTHFQRLGHDIHVRKITEQVELLNCDYAICIMPIPVFIRKFSKSLKNKFEDPGIVLIDPCCRYVIPLIGIHTKGAYDIALELADLLKLELIDTSRHPPYKCVEYMMFKLWLRPVKLKRICKVDIDECTIGTDSEQICYIAKKYFNANIELVKDLQKCSKYDIVIVSSSASVSTVQNVVFLKQELILGVGVCSLANIKDIEGLAQYAAYLSFTVPERFDKIVMPKHASSSVISYFKKYTPYSSVYLVNVNEMLSTENSAVCESLIRYKVPNARIIVHKQKFSAHATFAVGIYDPWNKHILNE